MASARDLRKKIRSITNTKKITRTMELVATSKAKRAQDRVKATGPYSEKLTELLGKLAEAGSVEHALIERREPIKRVALIVITANRGMCGGYNSNTLSLAEVLRRREIGQGRDLDLSVVGRKGVQRMRFLGLSVRESYTDFDDRPTFAQAAAIAETLMERFLAREIDRAVIVSTRYLSAGTQLARETNLLPLEAPDSGDKEAVGVGREFLFEPDGERILGELLPLIVKNLVYRLLVEAVASEQIARRMAMKRATDSAEEMISTYTRLYNRSRQAGITQEINEIVSGASALE